MEKRTMTSDEIVDEIVETLRHSDGELIAQIANQVLIPVITYDGNSLFSQEVED